ncbi:uroporphyrinogen-III synthase [soil metagenome]
MVKSAVKLEKKPVKQNQKVLITQAKPESDKSPYFEMARKYKLDLDFQPFIRVEGIPAKEFRKQKIEIPAYSAVIFTSRNAIDHFFRICEEMKITVSQHTKYFCITEAVALYLQKFILYRKRKVFYGADGTNKSLFDVINKHKEQENFLYPCSESFDSEITNWLKSNDCDYATPVLYKITSNDVKEILGKTKYDIICFFTPGGVKSFIENFPTFKKNGTFIGAFGENTLKAAKAAGLNPDIMAPQPKMPSMVSALEQFLSAKKK